jgi:hypothetical protein
VSGRRRAAPRRRPWLRLLGLLVALVVVFAVGVALGEALHDNPKIGGTQTLIRTLRPLALVPVARDTVTITTSKP